MMAALEPWISLRETSLHEEKLDECDKASLHLAEAVA